MRLKTAALAMALLAACGGEKPKPQTTAQAPGPPPAGDTGADAPAVAPVLPADYAKPEAWLCRPGREDACKQAATATAISANGRLTRDSFAPNPNAPIDCFYVYPTVSLDATPNSDIEPGGEEREIALQQLARFGSVCRLYAPMYRQATLTALKQMLHGETALTNREIAYADVKAAWEHYLANDNGGRGVVLVGHDQGAGLLIRLIASEIDGQPEHDRLVSAILPGANLAVSGPHDRDGSFKNIPLCTTADSLSCAISWVSFRADAPPREDSLFGKSEQHGVRVACVNPAELDGSQGQLKAMLPAAGVIDSMGPAGPWTTTNAVIETPFVMLPGMLSATCVDQGGFSYLAVQVAADPADKRTDTIAGGAVIDGEIRPGWGLHFLDINLAMGNLVEIVRRQSKAYLARNPAPPGAGQPASKPN